MRRVLGAVMALFLMVAGAAIEQAEAAASAQAAHGGVVSGKAVAWTPHVGAGTVYAFAQVGNKIVVGGKFASVTQTKTSAALTRSNLFAYNATTGVIDTGFAPAIDGEVDALQAGADGASVYVGGKFNNVNGVVARKLVKLSTTTGAAVAGFRVPFIDGPVNDFALAGGRLFVGGQFGKVGGVAHGGLVTLKPTTGAIDPFMNVQLTGHHNNTGQPGEAFALTGVYKFDVTPDASRLVAVGNFKYASGLDRDQLAVLDLGATSASVANWQTDLYKPRCAWTILDAWVRDVSLSPDGSYFAVVTTGAPYAGTLCDSTARWETGASGTGLRPTWVNFTGGDSLYSVAVTGSAVYIGGHMRWVNNSFATDSAMPGGVGRAGIAALDPVNGLPLSWNPGRNPRGGGAFALHATPTGLFVGSDTNYIGNFQYYHGKFAFFPLAGGKVTPPTTTAALPANVYEGGKISCSGCAAGNEVSRRYYDGSTAGAGTTVPDSGFAWSAVRGAVLINGTLFFGLSDGNFYRRSFNGTTFGTAALVDPYNDPYWSTVSASRGMTYRGLRPGFYGAEAASVTSMFFTGGLLYYTLAGQPAMYYRYFTPESGVIGADRFQVADGQNWSDAAGTFLSGGNLYVASRSKGHLVRSPWVGGQVTGGWAVISGPTIDGKDWRANAMFLG